MFLIQLIGVFAFIFLFVSYFLKEKDDILTFQLIAYMIFSIHYLLLGAFTGSLLELGYASSSFMERKHVKNKKMFAISFTILYVVIGIITFTDCYSLIPVLCCILQIFTLLYGNEYEIRLSGGINAFGWAVYSLVVSSYVSFYFNILLIIFIAFCMFLRRKK